MAKNLVIVESPAKAKTISRFLGKEYKVLASMGHVMDLPKSEMGVDTAGSFEPIYNVSADKKKVVSQLRDELKNAEKLWIATDEDREGEAIGAHLLTALKVTKKTPVMRIVFHEITKGAIDDAMKSPRSIDEKVVDAQKARRVLDRLVGYELSPLLWKKVQYGLSAGRVQSVAVRLVVEREREIEAFKPEEYWRIIGIFENANGETFEAELMKFQGKKFVAKSGDETEKVLGDLKGADYAITSVEKKQVKRNPAPPFITSTLQQEASRKLNFSVKKTMMVAQQLYEGVNIGEGETGLITYMRTDSVNLSNVALQEAKEVITKEFGKEYALDEPRRYKGRKGAQEAHEAIRPVSLGRKPEFVAKYLNHDQIRLYELIWKRTLACQMAQAILNKTGVDVEARDYTFRATGQTIEFDGFMKVYMEDRDEGEASADAKNGGSLAQAAAGDEEASYSDNSSERLLPVLAEGEKVKCNNINTSQHFTKPPARYTEASLVKKLESEGIGRPSTYAPTISTIMARGYIEKEGKSLVPTSLAMLITDILVEHFSDIVDYKFTAEMEEKLDDVEEGKVKWVPMIKDFYGPFHRNIELKEKLLIKEDLLKERSLGKDPVSGLEVVVRHGRFGPFVQLGNFSMEEIKKMEEKPRRGSLTKGTLFETITLEEALKILSLPRELGEIGGEKVIVTVGPYGPYLKVGKKNVALPKEVDPYVLEFGQVEGIVAADKENRKKMLEPIAILGKDPVSGGEISVKNGRFGPYVTDGTTNISVKKDVNPAELSFEEACEMLERKRKMPVSVRGKFRRKK
ncbi:type I DNA topoisomerase [Candidatus Peregrinibacteria bacterium]|nr:type I DNA topoisomerase [Candidatus Peregrinibacteria bacterium]